MKQKHVYSIRKFKIGASSAVIASFFFIGLLQTPVSAESTYGDQESSDTSHQTHTQLEKQQQSFDEGSQKSLKDTETQPNNDVSQAQSERSTTDSNQEKYNIQTQTDENAPAQNNQKEHTSNHDTTSPAPLTYATQTENHVKAPQAAQQPLNSPVKAPMPKPSNEDTPSTTLSDAKQTQSPYTVQPTSSATFAVKDEKTVAPQTLKSNEWAKTHVGQPVKTALTSTKEQEKATTQSRQRQAEKLNEQPSQKAKQNYYKNQDPIVLVHGFNGFVDDKNPTVLSHYWGGEKLNIRQYLEENGYNTYEASVSAFGSNYDRAVELYYYIKGGRVDYGAAHAAKYGHERYGNTYEGIYKDWEPGKKIHLVGHSMGGQTIRVLEELLRNGSQEEIEYQKEHGGTISPLFKGGHDNMVASITTLGTPHNGTHAADLLGNEPIVRQFVFDFAAALAKNDARVDFGLNQWGLKRKPGETDQAYTQRIKNNNKLWTTKDNGFYDLTREGASEINKHTSLNPNIVYKTYTGEATHATLSGKQKANRDLFLTFALTANVIGKAPEKDWRVNDGLVSVVSSLHPYNQAWTNATDQIQKGIWQVTPVKEGWDHVDFVGQDTNDTNHTQEQLQNFWLKIADDLVKTEEVVK
ncbi:YSIRK-targeted triacylglycerol lipase [Staphylococcus coagulans]|uniref:YSIRK-targeted triacylglycerol lipase n=1 Tax=Staphylococcus coagulans TaxID=74706 RepID=UPI0015FC6BA3|nr:triacylglycerol lipase [Staphylococcus coagulans]MBA8764795.1 YSIRK-type signal peptide-containing protein [Staphylococcus coagulans]MBT2810251.1 YSIRK-type signal peptide-containing protein [Staphylococcus coagulans]MBT2812106.1 YSIRK-type signal peptide-containing protein [Staphylococcus coagulans]MBT2819291.1 YSIRK-type signal peptide-containing protein [Staphylococcus coagulans]MBT2821568.1 YSIRK-type signal peptide-containing protein [Staphylococcus coagulans]